MKTTLTMTKFTALATAAGLLAACASMLPTTTSKSQTPWASYDDARKAYDSVAENKTTDDELRSLGFDVEAVPNIRVINYVDVAAMFGSAFTRETMPEGVRKCLDAKDHCFAYVVRAQNVTAKRNGNVAADLFGFRKQTHTTGWEMQTTLVLVNKVVVYKLWNGTPEIDTFEKQVTPLGPMQNMGFIFPKPF
ncbi:MAG: hypothetical protein GC129_02855 [Proteobacteria bacterium]|nr:hypothetical protein [Pseudomonadota bacterium]